MKYRIERVSVEWGLHKQKLKYYVFDSQNDGLHVFVIAGVHGNETLSIFQVLSLLRWIKKSKIKTGKVTLLPVANPNAVLHGVRRYPIDGLDLARQFPGDSRGSISQKIASEIFQRCKEADIVIDLHNIPIRTEGFISTDISNEICKKTAELMKPRFIVNSRKIKGTLLASLLNDGITALEVETEEIGRFFDVKKANKGVSMLQNLLIGLNLTDGVSDGRLKKPIYLEVRENLRSPIRGIYRPTVRPSQWVYVGKRIGYVESFHSGQKNIISGIDGYCIAISRSSFVFKGTRIAIMGLPAGGNFI